MTRLRYFAVMAALAALCASASAADNDKASAEKQQKLIATLQSTAAPAEKAMACKQLAICGTADAVPALTALLPDKDLSSWARIALEVIPGAAADEALRTAAGKLQGRLLIGALNSIGVRRDAKAVGLLIGRLKDADAEVASTAAVALAHVGGAEAVKNLEQSLATSSPAVRPAVAEACILCAEAALDAGNAAEAARLYDAVRKADVPALRVLDATRGAILARGTAGLPLLVEQLRSADKAHFALGLRTARELAGREVTDAVLAEYGRAAPERQALLILVLADRGDAAALPAVLQAATSGPAKVRIVAFRVLGRLGDASCVPLLLGAAVDADAELAQTALSVLADLPGKNVDADLLARLQKADGKARLVLIQLAGQRMIAAATAPLLKAADDPDAAVRAAALTALGATIELGDLPVLIARVTDPKNPEEATAASKSLSAACQRMPDQDACAEKLVGAMSKASVPAKRVLLEVLATLGGAKSLQAVAAAAKDANPEIQDTGSRLLGEWMSVDAAPVLLDLAKTAADEKYRIRAMRGYIRLARQFTMADAQRAEMCRIAMETAARDDEKKLVLDVLQRYPSVDTLNLALKAAKTPALKDDATAASLAIAQKVGGNAVDLNKVLAAVGHRAMKIEILKAEYGQGAQVKDVTAIVRQCARDFPVIALPSPEYNSSFGGDPAPGVVKQLKIQYRMTGKTGEATFQENATILLPMPK